MKTIGSPALLVVEDSNADFRILKRLINKMGVQNPVYRAQTGDEALEHLYQKGSDEKGPLEAWPSIILLDLNLPGTDGRDILVKLKQDQTLTKIPVVIFTTSSAPKDIEFCYQNGANGYMVKPLDLEALNHKIQIFVDYWLGVNTSPFFC